MIHDVFDAEFQAKLIAKIRECMTLALHMQQHIHHPDFTSHKDDHSPVTKADHEVQELLEIFLRKETPYFGFIGEETLEKKKPPGEIFWLCDPIDGTREYAKGGDDFAIILALINEGRPVFGLIAAPVSGEIAYLLSATESVIRHADDTIETIENKPLTGTKLIVGHGGMCDVAAFEKRFGVKPEIIIVRPSALKFFDLLRGKADYYIRTGNVSEWDIAAGEALLCAAGGGLYHFDGKTKIIYGDGNNNFLLNGLYAIRSSAVFDPT